MCYVFFLLEPISVLKRNAENSFEKDRIFRIKYFDQGFFCSPNNMLVWFFFFPLLPFPVLKWCLTMRFLKIFFFYFLEKCISMPVIPRIS